MQHKRIADSGNHTLTFLRQLLIGASVKTVNKSYLQQTPDCATLYGPGIFHMIERIKLTTSILGVYPYQGTFFRASLWDTGEGGEHVWNVEKIMGGSSLSSRWVDGCAVGNNTDLC